MSSDSVVSEIDYYRLDAISYIVWHTRLCSPWQRLKIVVKSKQFIDFDSCLNYGIQKVYRFYLIDGITRCAFRLSV